MAGAALTLGTLAPLGPLGSTSVAAAEPAPPADRCYAARLVEVFLDHEATPVEVLAWTQAGGDRPLRHVVPAALARSDAWLAAVVTGVYDDALDRTPDAEGLAFWIGRLRGGARVATLTATVHGSAEVWTRAGATPAGFVADVFPRIMGRAPSDDDVAFWAGQVAGRGRGGVAKALVGSAENRRARVVRLYQAVLDRSPDGTGLDYWVDRLATLDDVQLAKALAGSQEAYDVAQGGCVLPPAPTLTALTDGNGTSQAPTVSDDGAWVAFGSDATDLLGPPGTYQNRAPYLLDRATSTLGKLLQANREIRDLSLSADGRHLSFVTEATNLLPATDLHPNRVDVFTWDRVDGTVTRVTDGNASALSPDVSADGRFIAFASSAKSFDGVSFPRSTFLWDRTTGAVQRVSGTDIVTSFEPVVAPGGEAVYFTGVPQSETQATLSDYDTYRWDRATGTLTKVADDQILLDVAADGDVVTMVFRPTLATTLHLHDAQTGTDTAFAPSARAINDAKISADGSTVVITHYADDLVPGDDNGDTDVYLWERETGAIARISPPARLSARPSISADGRIVVFHTADAGIHDFEVQLWDRGS